VSESRIEALLAAFWERRERGGAVTPEQFAREHADAGPELLPALAALLATSALLPVGQHPQRIGRYRVEARLGQGATGEVFAVVDDVGQPAALKRLLPHAAMVERAQRRLAREAQVLRQLRHPNVVPVFEVDTDTATGLPFLVMERIDGASIASWLAGARDVGLRVASEAMAGPGDPWQRIARVVAGVARAVAAAHAVGVLHRDLKPGNVLLRRDGTPVVVDFGLASDERAATCTATGDVLGTPNYMAPEQARGEHATAASDVYGLGALLFELLTGNPPRGGNDALQVLDAARRDPTPRPRAWSPAVPRELDLIARRAMAFAPRHRHASAAELAHALELVAAGGRPLGLTLGWSLQLEDFWRRRRRVLVAAVAVLAGIAAAWVSIDTWQQARAERLRHAMVVAAECHLDGDTRGLEAAAAELASRGERPLATFLRTGEVVASDPFVQALADGRAQQQAAPASALAQFARAVQLRPDAAIGSALHGIAAARHGDQDVAERELTTAVRMLPNSVRLRLELGRVLRRASRSDEALHHLSVAVALPRANGAAWHELAKAHAAGKQYAAGLVAIERALALARGERSSMLRTKAVLLDGHGDHEAAANAFRELAEQAPSAETWHSFGRAVDSLHRFDEAAAAYRKAVDLDAHHQGALVALVHLHTGSDHDCEQCRAFFRAHPDRLDAAVAERAALQLLECKDGGEALHHAARYLARTGGGGRFAAAIAERLQQDLPDGTLGALVRAQRALRGN
jgi:tetratricopeptide (TPR) repeat protein